MTALQWRAGHLSSGLCHAAEVAMIRHRPSLSPDTSRKTIPDPHILRPMADNDGTEPH